MWVVIGTWRMSLEAIEEISVELSNSKDAGDSLVNGICKIEDFPYFKSVGYGGLPNENMIVELDAGYMDGNTFDIGAIGGVRNVKNPIKLAKRLSKEKVNNFLVGSGAENFAIKEEFDMKNMLSERAIIHYKNRIKEEQLTREKSTLKPYIGHDTVGLCTLDKNGKISAGTSTSGLFMKREGRIGDSPIPGAGFYADSDIGAATATGLGEDLMKGCISYEIVKLIESGLSPQQACDQAVRSLQKKLSNKRENVGDMSVVAIDKKGNFGVSTNIKDFSFVVAREDLKPTVYITDLKDDKTTYNEATEEWLNNYMKTRTSKLNIL